MFKILFLILVVMSSAFFAQSQKQQSFKFDEFKEISESEWKQRLDRLAEMQKGYPDSYISIIVYAQIGNDRKSLNKIKEVYKNYLTKDKKAERVFVESGGFRKLWETELWICPKDADFPKATPTENFKSEKFAEFGTTNEEEFKKHFDDFFIKLNSEPSDTGYIINYGKPSDIAERERMIRDNINFRRFDGVRIVIVNGGESENLKTVLWIVPAGAEPPTP